MKAGVGLSQNVDDHRCAAIETTRKAPDKFEGKNPGIIFAFSSTLHDKKDVLVGIRNINSVVPQCEVV